MASIERVHVSTFDLHLWKAPIVDAQGLNAALAPLVNGGVGNANRAELPSLCVFSLDHHPERHRFWRRYREFANFLTTSQRYLLLPLRCRPKNFKLQFVLNGAQEVPAFATIWLWSFGWVSSLEFAFKSPLNFSDVQKMSAALRGKPGEAPFRLNGNAMTLPQVFDSLARKVRQDVPASTAVARGDDLIVSKHAVISVVPPNGAQRRRYGAEPAALQQWSDSERSRFHAALLGKDVSLAEVIQREKGKSFMLTRLGGENFGITYFEEGTLLFLRASLAAKWRESGRCFARNVNSVSLSALALERVVEKHARAARTDAALGRLVDAARELLDDMRTGYRNSFARQYFKAKVPPRVW